MSALINILFWVVVVFGALLLVRLVFDWVKTLAKTWQPAGVALVFHDVAYGLTDPALKLTRRGTRPIPIGRWVKLDVAFLVVMLVCSLLFVYLGGLR